MVEIHLKSKNPGERRILEYLENNASAELAEKINGGVVIEKDGKQLLNMKTLGGFMKWACEEARKQAEKGANFACVDDETVFGWAIHYFEESSIEETLYNDDGTEYTPPKPVRKPSAVTVTPKPVVKKESDGDQQSIFDMLSPEPVKEEPEETDEENDDDEEVEIDDEDIELGDKDTEMDVEKALKKVSPLYEQYMAVQKRYPDAVIAKRIGDFYEVLGAPAKTIAPELDLTLTGRDCGLSQRIPMVGFPYHRAEEFFGRIRKQHTLVITENEAETVLEKYVPVCNTLVDRNTGEVVETAEKQNSKMDFFDLVARSFDEASLSDLYERLDRQIDIY